MRSWVEVLILAVVMGYGRAREVQVSLLKYSVCVYLIKITLDLSLVVITVEQPGQYSYTILQGQSTYSGYSGPLTHLISLSRASFLNLSRWLADARALGSPQLVTVLVGNKSDREDDREVEWAEASRWAAENGKKYTTRAYQC